MKSLKHSTSCLILVGTIASLAGARAQPAPGPGDTEALRALEQAPDPSAVVAAYANALVLSPVDPRLHAAYVDRMVELGLPELAYHQAQTLTTVQSTNGLAWAVVAYVDARRAQMTEALSAINVAGPLAPENRFVARTAGELLAWFDVKADKTTIPENTTNGLAKIRILMENKPAFTEAYARARQAYQGQASTDIQTVPAQPPSIQVWPPQATPGSQTLDPSQVAPVPASPQSALQEDQMAPLGYAPEVAAPVDAYADAEPSDWTPYSDYGWGPGWVAPSTTCWWQPCGFWGGYNFLPFGSVCLFGDYGDFHHFHHGGDWAYDGRYGRFGSAGGFGDASAFWHNGRYGRQRFFGAPAAPTVAGLQRPSRASRPGGNASRWWSGVASRGAGIADAPGTLRPTQIGATSRGWASAPPIVATQRSGPANFTQRIWGSPSPYSSQAAPNEGSRTYSMNRTIPYNSAARAFSRPYPASRGWANPNPYSAARIQLPRTYPARNWNSYRQAYAFNPAPYRGGSWRGGTGSPRFSGGAAFSSGFHGGRSFLGSAASGSRGGSVSPGFSGGTRGGGSSFGGGFRAGGFGAHR